VLTANPEICAPLMTLYEYSRVELSRASAAWDAEAGLSRTVSSVPPRLIDDMSPQAIDNEIANYERLKKTSLPRYAELVRARGARGGFEVERSKEIILKAAREGRCLSYKELADAYGMDWSVARHPINAHLGDLVAWGAAHGFPMLSAIVVNQANLQTRKMDEITLKGFIAAAARLGLYDGSEPEKFLRTQQDALFAHVRGRAER
jgi:hypothetical protein